MRFLLAQNDKFTEEEMHNYRMAVTEREVPSNQIVKTKIDGFIR